MSVPIERRTQLPIITALHCMQGGLASRKLSVRLSVKCMDCHKTEEKSV